MQARVWIAILLASLGWGTSGVAVRGALLEGVPPFTIIPVRFVVASLALLAVVLMRGRGLPVGRHPWRRGAVLGVVNMAGPTIFLTLALQYISAGLGGLLVALSPILTAVAAHLLLADERLQQAKLAGLGVSLGGVAVLLLSGETGIAGGGGNPLLGGALSLIGVSFIAAGSVYSRKFAVHHPVLDLAVPQFLVGAVTALAAAAWVEWPQFAGVTAAGWLLMLYIALIGTVLPFLMFLRVVQHASATKASLIGYLVPIVGVLGGMLALDERVTLGIAAGGVLILLGVLMVDRAERRPQRVAAR